MVYCKERFCEKRKNDQIVSSSNKSWCEWVCMNRYTPNQNVLRGTVLFIHRNILHRLQCVHSIYHLSDCRIHHVQLGLLIVYNIELALVCIWVLLGHGNDSSPIELPIIPISISHLHVWIEFIFHRFSTNTFASFSFSYFSCSKSGSYRWDHLLE